MAYRRTDHVSARLADTRRRILNAARELVAEGGFSAAQMTEVARKAAVATGTLYRYFPSKEELCRQVFREVSAREMNLLVGIAQGEGSARERLDRVLRTFAPAPCADAGSLMRCLPSPSMSVSPRSGAASAAPMARYSRAFSKKALQAARSRRSM